MNDQRLRLLVIDDDRTFCALLRNNLSRLNHDVTFAHSADEGLAMAAAQRFDALVLDHDLREMTGLDVLENLRRQKDVPPVIVLTASHEVTFAIAALKAGAADYVIKDGHGEFYALLDRAIRTAVNAALMEHKRQQMEAEVLAARDRFKKMAEERELMLNEINHRISNSLQLVTAMLSIQGELTAEESAKTALNEARSRVLAIAQVHRSLYSSFDVGWVGLDEYLGAVVKDLRKMNEGEGPQSRTISFEASAIQTTPDVALASGIVMTELVLNAFKHAYGGNGGEVRVKLKTDAGQVCLLVEDDGNRGPGAETRPGTGFGKRLIARKLERLNGSVDYRRTERGMTVVLQFPITEDVRVHGNYNCLAKAQP